MSSAGTTLRDIPADLPRLSGDIVGRAFRVCRRNIGLLFRVLLVPTILVTVAVLLMQWAVTHDIPAAVEGKDAAAGARAAVLILVGLLGAAGGMIVVLIRQLALVRMLTGCALDYASADRQVCRRAGALIGALFVNWFIFVAVLGFWLAEMGLSIFFFGFTERWLTLPAGRAPAEVVVDAIILIVGFSGMLASAFACWMAGMLALCVIACGDEPVFDAIGRSFRFVFKHFGRALGFVALVSLAFAALSYPLSLPAVIFTLLDMFMQGLSTESFPEAYKAPLYVMAVCQLWESLVGIIIRPAVFFALGLFYFDLRMRDDGVDMARRLQALKSRAHPDAGFVAQ